MVNGMNKVFIGVDQRQWVAYHVLSSSIIRRSSEPVSITPIIINQVPIERVGLTGFTFARYLPPYLCKYEGRSVFLDSDMLVLGDITELFNLPNPEPVSVVPFEGKLAFERPSVMLFNNKKCDNLVPEYIDNDATNPQSLEWAESVGELPFEWNHLVGYSPPQRNVKLVHYTQGVPGYKECRHCEYSHEWFKEKAIAFDTEVSWLEIMGHSVHAKPVLQRLQEGM